MLRLVRLLLVLLGCLVLAVLAVANRQPVDVSFWPLPYALTVPLFGVALFCLILGALLAGLVSWLAGMGRRAQAYRDRRRVIALEARARLREEQEEQAEIHRQRDRRTQLAVVGERS
jgi:uncharacterized integral membrane protein